MGPGVWETSGILGVTGILQDALWITDVQGPLPYLRPEADTVEDDQLSMLRAAFGAARPAWCREREARPCGPGLSVIGLGQRDLRILK